MKRLIPLFLISSISLLAATTQVTQSVLGPDGLPASGRVSIAISSACKSGSSYVGIKPVSISFSAGAFSVSLVPNDSCLPAGTTYAVNWQLQGGNGWTETWLVPTSTLPVSVDSVVVHTVPPLSYVIQWGQMGQNGATNGQFPAWNGTSWVPESLDVLSMIGYTPENITHKGVPNGYAPLDGSGLVPVANLPIAGQVNSDWTATSGVAQILNKPTIPSNTSQITENTNLYFTQARAIAAMAGLYQAPITGAPGVWPSFAAVATSGSYADLSNKPTIPTDTSQISENGSLYFTNARAVAALAGLYQAPITGAPGAWPSFAAVATSGSYTDLTNKPTIPTVAVSSVFGRTGAVVAVSGDYTTALITEATNLYFTNARAVSALAGLYQTPITGAPGTWPSFAAVATSGSYTDLSSTPTIPALSSTTPLIDGVGAAGTAITAARGDHVHPVDTSRQAALGFTPENAANRNIASGYAPLDASSLVPLENLPTIPYSQLSGAQATITGAPGTWPSFAAVATSGSYTDLLSKPTIAGPSITTPLINGTAAIGSAATYAKADHVHPTDTTRAAVATVTTGTSGPAVYSDCLCARGGDTSISGVTCDNAAGSDATGLSQFTQQYSVPGNAVQANTAWRVYSAFSYWSALGAPSIQMNLNYGNGNPVYASNTLVGVNSLSNIGGTAQWHFIGASAGNVITELDYLNLFASTAGLTRQTVAQPTAQTTSANRALIAGLKYMSSSGIGTGTYTSGGSLAGTGTCTLTTFNGAGGTGATASVPITAGVIGGGTALTITNTGSGYTGTSTTATLGNGTGTGVCSGTATVVTVLGGAQGNAVCQLAFIVTKE